MNTAKLIQNIQYITPAAVVYADALVTLFKNTPRDLRAINRAVPFHKYGIHKIKDYIQDRQLLNSIISKNTFAAAAERAGAAEDPGVQEFLKIVDTFIAKYSERVISG